MHPSGQTGCLRGFPRVGCGVWPSRRRVWRSGTDICLFTLNTCVFMCIQFEGPKSAQYTWSIGSLCCIRAIQRTRLASRPLRSYTAIQRYTLYSYKSLYTISIQAIQHPSAPEAIVGQSPTRGRTPALCRRQMRRWRRSGGLWKRCYTAAERRDAENGEKLAAARG